MDKLILQSRQLAYQAPKKMRRFLDGAIDWSWKLIGIRGARGVGKTTLLLQRMQGEHSIYLSLDDIYFSSASLRGTIEALRLNGYTNFYLDEVHKYPGWSKEIKNLHDLYPDIYIIFTGSSIIEMKQLEVDLSRRALLYDLPGLSFREFLQVKDILSHKVLTLPEILGDHEQYTRAISKTIKPIVLMQEYLQFGYYPYFLESKTIYHRRLNQVIRLILESDLALAEGLGTIIQVQKLGKLLQFIANAVPFKPNIANIARHLELDRTTVLRYIGHLSQARLISLLHSPLNGLAALQKPEKIYLENTNLAYVLSAGIPDKGNLRETFFYNQLSINHELNYSEKGDFLVDEKYIFEIGGANKNLAQIGGISNSYLAMDDLENGYANRIPLWLFGFLY
jgi:predicted AAA+ superfamily ATPase